MTDTEYQYGLRSRLQAADHAKRVAGALGGGHNAYCQILETACAETLLGLYPDKHPEKWGVGLCQHDEINLIDIKQHLKPKHRNIIINEFGYDIAEVQLKDLAYDPLLSIICCRLSYLRIEYPIPNTLTERAEYWKEHYNRSGDGKPWQYIERVHEILGDEWQ